MKWKKFNAAVIDEFRRKGGKVARFGGLPLIVLQTVSATSSQRLDVPLIPVFDERSMFVFATNAGSQQDPDWVENLLCQSEISVEYETNQTLQQFNNAADGGHLSALRAPRTYRLDENGIGRRRHVAQVRGLPGPDATLRDDDQ